MMLSYIFYKNFIFQYYKNELSKIVKLYANDTQIKVKHKKTYCLSWVICK
jgi:hypothetical protein